jgi:polyisoprenoid-binding protein YceI
MAKLWTVAAVVLLAGAPADGAEYKFAPSSKIEFVGTKPDGSHTGGFKQFTGTVTAPEGSVEGAAITVEIKMDSTYSDNPMLTRHLLSPDFFDVRTHPTARFVSTAVKAEPGPNGATHSITGNLTLHGVTKSVTFPAKVSATAQGLTMESAFTLPRKEFGITYGEGKIHNDVTIKLAVQATK